MKIEVGEYVRTNNGLIGKLIRIERDDIDTSLKWYVFYDNKNERYINKPYITKHSKNIIDLIEVGDYVNESRVDKIELCINEVVREHYLKINDNWAIYNWNIKTILTKEQYNKNCYRLEK